MSTGKYGSAEAMGDQCVAVAWGEENKARGAIGCWLVLSEHNKETPGIKNVILAKIDGEAIKADTWYTLEDGKIVEVSDE